MDIKINLTEGIINESLALHFNHQAIGKRQKQKLVWIPLILITIAVYIIYSESRLPVFTQNFYLAWLYIAFAISYYFFMRKRMVKGGGKILKALGTNASFEMDITEEKITTITNATTIINDWTVFTGALISEKIVLLYQVDNSFVMLHESFFHPGDFGLLKLWVREKVTPLTEA